jgi:cell division protein FtsW
VNAPSVRHPGEFRWETRLLAVVTLALTVFGVANCLAAGAYLEASYHEATQLAGAAIVGGVIFLVAAYTDYHVWRRFAKPLLIATLIGLVLIAIPAVIWGNSRAPGAIESIFPLHGGGRRWIRLGFQIQVSEIARFTLAAYLAARLAEMGTKIRSLREGLLPLLGIVGVTVVLVALEPSLSVAVLIAVVGAAIVFTAGARISHLLLPVVLGVVLVGAVLVLEPVRAKRFMNYTDPCNTVPPKMQACNSLTGFGSGGITGTGFGRGNGKLGHMPLIDSDFLLSGVGEEWGFIGVVFVCACFAIFCWMGFRIAKTARDPFGTYLASGLTLGIGVSAFMHAAVVTAMMPVTGLTLPFMSAGRVSVILCLFSAGVLVSIGRQRGRPARAR